MIRELPDCFRCIKKDCHYIDPDGSCSKMEVDWSNRLCHSYKKRPAFKDSKIIWVEDDVWDALGENLVTGLRATYYGHVAEVYPVGKIGFEYRIRSADGQHEFDSLFETSIGRDHAPTSDRAIKWATSLIDALLKDWGL